MAAKLNLDKLDLQIIHEMMENAEISYADLGKQLFVSGGTIHVRIKKLQELAVVKGTKLHVDLKQLGYDVIAFIGIYLEKSSLYDSVARELHKIPEIVRLNYTTGNYSMFAEIVCKDINQLRFVLHDELQKIKVVSNGRRPSFLSTKALAGMYRFLKSRGGIGMPGTRRIHTRTSSTSRSPFPSRLNASTSTMIARPGASASMGLCVMMKL